MTPLSAHFSLEEAIASQTAARLDIDNDPPLDVVRNMKKAALGMELVRMELNSNAIHVSSWYRSPKLNEALGSKPTSAHTRGFAIDFTCPTAGRPVDIVRRLKASGLKFDQLIHEFNSWIHISFDGERRQVLTIDKSGTKVFV